MLVQDLREQFDSFVVILGLYFTSTLSNEHVNNFLVTRLIVGILILNGLWAHHVVFFADFLGLKCILYFRFLHVPETSLTSLSTIRFDVRESTNARRTHLAFS